MDCNITFSSVVRQIPTWLSLVSNMLATSSVNLTSFRKLSDEILPEESRTKNASAGFPPQAEIYYLRPKVTKLCSCSTQLQNFEIKAQNSNNNRMTLSLIELDLYLMIIYLCMKYESNTPMNSKYIARNPILGTYGQG